MSEQKQKTGKPTKTPVEEIEATADSKENMSAIREKLSKVAAAAFSSTKSKNSERFLRENKQSGGE